MTNRIGRKTWIGSITLIILLLTAFTTIVISVANTENDVEHNKADIQDIQSDLASIDGNVQANKNDITAIDVHYEHISQSLKSIENKIDVLQSTGG